MRKNFICIVVCSVLSLTVPCHGQLSGIELNAGTSYSFIGNEVTEGTNFQPSSGFSFQTTNLEVEEAYKNFFGFSLGGKTQFSLSKKLSLRAGLGFDYIKFERTVNISGISTTTGSFGLIRDGEIIVIDSDGQDTQITPDNLVVGDLEKGPAHLVYLSVPIELSYLFSNKIYGIVGISMARRIYSRTKGDVVSIDTETLTTVIEERTFTDGRGFNTSQWLANVGLGYVLNDKFNVEFAYSRGLTSIYEESSQIAGEAKYNLLRLGLSYQLLNTRPKKE